MWILRIVRGGEKMTSVSDKTGIATKREMLREVNKLGALSYQRRMGNMLIVHIAN